MSADESSRLERLCSSEHRLLAQRARIVLLDAAGRSVRDIADEVGVAPLTVYKWRGRFRASGIDALRDRPRPGQPRKMSADGESTLLARVRNTLPKDSIAWSTRGLARSLGVSQHQVRTAFRRGKVDADRVVRAIDDASLWMGLRPTPVALVFVPPHGALVFETRGIEAARVPDRRATHYVPVLRRRRHRASGLYAVCDSFEDESLSAASQATRVVALVRNCLDAASRGSNLHVLLSGEKLRAACGTFWSASVVRPRVVQTMPTLDAWVAAIESIWISIEQSGGMEGETFDRIVSLRSACERHVRAHRDGLETAETFVWHADDASADVRVRESGFFSRIEAPQLRAEEA